MNSMLWKRFQSDLKEVIERAKEWAIECKTVSSNNERNNLIPKICNLVTKNL